MKCHALQLASQLTTPFAIQVIHGKEPFLMQEAVVLIKKVAKQAGYQNIVHRTFETGTEEALLYQTLYTSSLMAAPSLILLTLQANTCSKAFEACLTQYARNAPREQCVVIQFHHADHRLTKSEWYQTIEKMGLVVAIWPLSAQQTRQWVIQRLTKYKLSLSPQALTMLLDKTLGNLAATAGVIEKLILFHAAQPIDSETMLSVLTEEAYFTPMQLIEALRAGEAGKSLRILKYLWENGTEPALILWYIMRALREHAVESANLLLLFQSTLALDQLIKTNHPSSAYEALQLFCLKFASCNLSAKSHSGYRA